MRQVIVRTRTRLVNGRGAKARYRLAGTPTIRHELECLGYKPLPGLRTIDRVLQEAGQTNPPFRLQPVVVSADYPGPNATASNQVHQCDLVGPRYLKGSRARYYFLVYKDVYDQTPYIEFHRAPSLDVVLDFVVRAWQRLGLPRHLQVDNGSFFAGSGRWPGSVGRFIRLALLVGIELVFIPPGEPFRNGSVENFNGS
jgi:transposase InsO family protein